MLTRVRVNGHELKLSLRIAVRYNIMDKLPTHYNLFSRRFSVYVYAGVLMEKNVKKTFQPINCASLISKHKLCSVILHRNHRFDRNGSVNYISQM